MRRYDVKARWLQNVAIVASDTDAVQLDQIGGLLE
jgi:hypothetical protein